MRRLIGMPKATRVLMLWVTAAALGLFGWHALDLFLRTVALCLAVVWLGQMEDANSDGANDGL